MRMAVMPDGCIIEGESGTKEGRSGNIIHEFPGKPDASRTDARVA